jgi:hypothetical protein
MIGADPWGGQITLSSLGSSGTWRHRPNLLMMTAVWRGPDKSTNSQHDPKGADMEFEENLFVTIVLILLLLVGVGICNLMGLGLLWMRNRGREMKRKRFYAGRVL